MARYSIDIILDRLNLEYDPSQKDLVVEVIEKMIEYIVDDNYSDFDLHTTDELEEEYNRGVERGQDDVTENPRNWNLYDQTDVDESYSDGESNVIGNPRDYDLYDEDAIEDLKEEWTEEREAEEASKW